ncbi:MAG: NHLP bacteriocin system secretion protein [Puniceicoccales bacterium]
MPSSPSSSTNRYGIFRKRALAARKAPEMDQIPRIIPSYGWLFILGIIVFLVGILVWSIIGRVPTTVSGRGIVISGGMVPSITAQGQGQIIELLVNIGDKVSPGQTVARVNQPVLNAQIRTQKLMVANLKQRLHTVTEQTNSLLKSQNKFLEKQKSTAKTTINDYESQIESLQKVVTAQEKLLKDGLIPLTTYIDSQTLLDTTQVALLNAENTLQMIISEQLDYQATADTTIFEAQLNLETAQATLTELESQLAEGATVVSNLEGTIVEVNVAIGGEVTPGMPVFSVEKTDEDLSAVLYFTAGPGKRIIPGMTAQVSPDTVTVDEYGFIIGEVTHVSDVPATDSSMMAYLSNDTVVQAMTLTGPQVQVLATLKKNPNTTSGFQWSSSSGPNRTVPSGTMATGRVIVEEQPPITLLVPLIKDLLGIVN